MGRSDRRIGAAGPDVAVNAAATGTFTLEADVRGLVITPPHVRPLFTGAVLPAVTVPVTVWIVRRSTGANPARDAAEIPNHLAGANMILWQSGLTLIQNGPYHLLNNTNWLNHIDVTNPANTNLTAMLNTTNSMGNAVELYFVNMLEGGMAAGVRWPEGIAIASGEDTAHTLAHEVLHDCGLEDIYTIENPDSSDPNPIPGPVSEGRIPSDWGGGYYLPGLTQRSLVTRLIMRSGRFGPEPPLSQGVCLPRGTVCGWRDQDTNGNVRVLGQAGVGRSSVRRSPGSY